MSGVCVLRRSGSFWKGQQVGLENGSGGAAAEGRRDGQQLSWWPGNSSQCGAVVWHAGCCSSGSRSSRRGCRHDAAPGDRDMSGNLVAAMCTSSSSGGWSWPALCTSVCRGHVLHGMGWCKCGPECISGCSCSSKGNCTGFKEAWCSPLCLLDRGAECDQVSR